MAYTVLLRIEAPLQSWGVNSRFKVRETQKEPSKSGIVGCLCAALGIDRSNDNDMREVAKGKMGVRIDHKGSIIRDFQIAKNVLKLDGKEVKDTEVLEKDYLSDASFLVGLEYPERDLPFKIYNAIKNPVYAITYGRKCCVPSKPIWCEGEPVNKSVFDALKDSKLPYRNTKFLYFVLEDTTFSAGDIRHDQPFSFNPKNRQFLDRHVETKKVLFEQKEVESVGTNDWLPDATESKE